MYNLTNVYYSGTGTIRVSANAHAPFVVRRTV